MSKVCKNLDHLMLTFDDDKDINWYYFKEYPEAQLGQNFRDLSQLKLNKISIHASQGYCDCSQAVDDIIDIIN